MPLNRRHLATPVRLRRVLGIPWRAAGAAALLIATTGVQAQSLQALYDAARGFDATYLAAKSQAEAVQYLYERTKALQRPTLDLSASTARNSSDGPILDTSYQNVDQATLNARQQLFNRGDSLTIDQSERNLQIASADLEAAEQDLIVRLTQAYFEVLARQDTLSAAQANKVAIAEQLASAKRNFEVGTATITDTREAQARFDLATAQEISTANGLRNARIALDQLVGMQDVSPKPLATPLRLPELEPSDVESWVARMPDTPVVRRAALNFDIAKLETGKANAGNLPTVDLVGSYGKRQNRGTSTSNLGNQGVDGTYTNASIGVQLNLPLFSGFSVQNRVKETVSLEEKSRNDLDAARRSVTQLTRQSYYDVQSSEASMRALEAAESSSKLALEATQLGYKVGVRVNLDVLNAQTQLFNTQRDLSRARYDVVINRLKLRQAAGALRPEDVANANRFLLP